MDAMVGLPGCQRILIVVAAQLLLLSAVAALSIFMMTSAVSAGPLAEFLTYLVLPLAALLLIYASLKVLSEPVELLWSINAKLRLKRWVFPALAAGVVLCLIAFGAALMTGPAVRWPATVELLAYAVPMGALSLFALNGIKRYLAMRRGASDIARVLAAGSPDTDGLARVRVSFDNEMGRATTNVRPGPQGFNLAGVTSRPFHDPASFPWMRAFEENVGAIRAEAEAVLKLHAGKIDIYKYPGLEGEMWKAFKLVARHQPFEENMAACPITARLLKTVPGYPVFRDAMFSILEPGGVITPHRDVGNIYLTAHLGLRVPEGGYIEVAGERRHWRENAFTVFDSSYEHRAVNETGGLRVILLIDFLHPEITASERDWINRVGL
ncbi:MAG: aspartyl/asparaginyl beta-hydroxylase domain-containing protein [Hyphomonas sp.]|nr:aspartyl/asparaginyl beta-hydroxylase domain-containing protein [Hyphomonas sp.]MDP3458722.1 aspartyl/asparaginyl beta-hydroxylase domain-containing protein [Hyphomonas sp.]